MNEQGDVVGASSRDGSFYTLPKYPVLWRNGAIVQLADFAGQAIDINNHGQVLINGDRKSTRLNSSHLVISYAVFCLKKKKISNLTTCQCNSAPPKRVVV